ncbi:1,4-dihydroxy-6-naphthoate synthase [Tenuifilum thalassicum]|uniref:1,4-dihydroxy-6-naphtoate synthase n=1 Tax=Tenuifilum thalassicum TaxID=2590900 RepID=A0A7D4BD43_9BACT|nr:1,4-dihydroxy-6-naphthoate synthase [Tenuifilum thalassicum]QKG79383.1 1,4-dihydroxy-6-naphthoate synthase [Tenuifilum thalassicum]
MKLTLNFSTCPNDTFMFYAMVNGIVNSIFEFETTLEDIEDLNVMALKGEPDITKISFGVYPQLYNDYQLLDAGSALGEGVGPLLVSKSDIDIENLHSYTIALPGKHTTAHLLFNLAFPKVKNKKFMLFSKVEDAILAGDVDAGVIIHESRFTYAQKGLIKLADLGDLWEKQSGLPTPLGGIAVRRSLPEQVKSQINKMLRESIEFAFKHPESTFEFVRKYAQEMDLEVMKNHIELYVNKYSISLENQGRKAIVELLKRSISNSSNIDVSSIFIV